MITGSILKILANNRYKDCFRLFLLRRYQGCIYIGGYVVELLLKYNICDQYGLNAGYPETKLEFNRYSSISGFSFVFPNVQTLKTHDLNSLLKNSGREYDVKSNAIKEWDIITSVINWKPEMRYMNTDYLLRDAFSFIKSVIKIKKILIN